ncbi:Exopolyphosphatase [Coemansia sp. Benny D160-2]|nr:Exopolyphosphatase [Coemansia sp. Benny D160-2]
MKLISNFSSFVKVLAGNTALLNDVGTLGTSNLTLVLGNESADLDSMVSSLTLAYVLSAQKNSSSVGNVVAVMNTNRADMVLRQDCQMLLQSALLAEGGKGIEDLTFIDDIDLQAVVGRYSSDNNSNNNKKKEQEGIGRPALDVWLVDHNAPASRQSFLEDYVRGIVDHHVDEGKCQAAQWREIESVGSCSTLVAAKVRSLGNPVDPTLAKLMLAPVLLDTDNFSAASQRATEKDRDIRSWLVPLVEWAPHASSSSFSSLLEGAAGAGSSDAEGDDEAQSSGRELQVSSAQELYKTLDKLKGSVKHLASEDLLRKDYKQWQVADGAGKVWAVGISSVAYRMQKWLKRDGVGGVEDAVQAWIAKQGLDVALIMTHGKARPRKKQPKAYGRDLAVGFSQAGVSGLQESLLVRLLRESDTLGLQSLHVDDLQSDMDRSRMLFFAQTRSESSRKQVFPAVKHAIESM